MTGLLDGLASLVLLHPGMLLLAAAVPAALWFRRRARRPALLLSPLGLPDPGSGPPPPLPRTLRGRLRGLPRGLQVLALLLVVVALARPVRRVALPERSEGIDILLCLDRSSSMTATDLDGRRTRLEAARDAAAAFVAARPDDRIGILAFARYPDLLCPPTLDHAALAAILRGVEPVEADGPEDATGIGAAVARAAEVLRGGGGGARVAVLLTDGEENVAGTGDPEAIAPLHAGQLCAALGVRVYTVAAGAAPGRIDTRAVEDLAARTGGLFQEARDAGALAEVYARVDALERSAADRNRFRVEERYAGFVAAALGLLLLGGLLRIAGLGTLP